jgi:hypothetical protein
MQIFRPVALLLLLALGACAQQQAQPDFTPPPKRPLDAKTQLENSGR